MPIAFKLKREIPFIGENFRAWMDGVSKAQQDESSEEVTEEKEEEPGDGENENATQSDKTKMDRFSDAKRSPLETLKKPFRNGVDALEIQERAKKGLQVVKKGSHKVKEGLEAKLKKIKAPFHRGKESVQEARKKRQKLRG